MFVATFETPNFTFQAAGQTEASAREALAEGWAEHCKQHPRAEASYLETCADDVRVTRVEAGSCTRDGEPLTGAAAA